MFVVPMFAARSTVGGVVSRVTVSATGALVIALPRKIDTVSAVYRIDGGPPVEVRGDIATLANAPSLFWAVGADALTPIFSGGRNKANLAAARASYDASVATYRQSVLTAFGQVEDGLSSLDALSKASETQAAAVDDARRQLELANNRYVGGVDNYLTVISAESTLLSNQRLAVQLLGQRMVATVYLVKALGGGWDAKQLEKQQVKPTAGQIVQP